MHSLVVERNRAKWFTYGITVCTGLFILFVLYKAVSPGLLDSILPNRFSHPLSLVFLMLSALICALVVLWAAGGIRTGSRLRNGQISLLFFCAAVLLSMPLIFGSDITPKWDFNTYYKMAEALSRNGSFGSNYVAAFPHTIGFPAALSVLFRLFGTSVLAAQLTGVFFSALSVSLVYVAGQRIAGRKIGLLAAVLWLFMPSRVLYTLLVCSENLFHACALLAVLLLIQAARAHGRKTELLLFGLSGILFSALSAVRPEGTVLFFVCLLVYLIFIIPANRLHTGRASGWKAVCCFLAAALFLLTSFFINQAILARNRGFR